MGLSWPGEVTTANAGDRWDEVSKRSVHEPPYRSPYKVPQMIQEAFGGWGFSDLAGGE